MALFVHRADRRLAAMLWPVLALVAIIGVAAVLPAREYLRAAIHPTVERPRPTGPFAVGMRDVPPSGTAPGYDLWFPAEADDAGWWREAWRGALARIAHPTRATGRADAAFAAADRPRPVVLFLPSWFNRRDESSFALANLASHGFVVVALDDVVHQAPFEDPEDRAAQQAGLDPSSPAAYARTRALAARRVQLSAERAWSAVAALAQSSDWRFRIDATRLGVVGFSFGGSVASELAADGRRVAAAVNLDGDLLVDRDPLDLAVPVLVLTSDIAFPDETAMSQPDPAWRLDAILTRKTFLHWIASPRASIFRVSGTTHTDFCDRLVMPPVADALHAARIERSRTWADINGAIVTFLDATLAGEAVAASAGIPASFHRLTVPLGQPAGEAAAHE